MTINQVRVIKEIALNPELQSLTAIRMAEKDLEAGEWSSAIARLKVDADKIRPLSQKLYDLINTF
jgi:hypothetical protein